MKIINVNVIDPTEVENPSGLLLWEQFFIPTYNHLYTLLNAAATQYPHVDFDLFKVNLVTLLATLTPVEISYLRKQGCGDISKGEWEKAPANKAMMVFLWHFPEFANLLTNIHLLAPVAIKSTELYLNTKIGSTNFIEAKRFIDQINRQRWTREQNTSEQQSGVSNLGGVSELLLEIAMDNLIDDKNFFKTNNQKVQ